MAISIGRRELISALGGAVVAWPLTASAQQRIPVVGFLGGGSPAAWSDFVAAFRQGLQETSFVEGQNVAIEYRFAEDHYDRLAALAADLVEHHVAVIAADPRGVYAAHGVTKTVPIVFMTGSDPVRNGLVASLNRPGGNLTGVTILASDLNAKRFGLFHDLVPQAAMIGVLSDATNPRGTFAEQEVQTAANSVGVTIRMISADTEREVDAAFATFARACRPLPDVSCWQRSP